jgi:hypothetical protein
MLYPLNNSKIRNGMAQNGKGECEMENAYLFLIDAFNDKGEGSFERETDKVRIEIVARDETQAFKFAKEVIKREKYITKFIVRITKEIGILEQIQNTLSDIANKD